MAIRVTTDNLTLVVGSLEPEQLRLPIEVGDHRTHFLKGAYVLDSSLMNVGDLLAIAYCGKSMSDDDAGDARPHLFQGARDRNFGFGVQGAGCLIENEESGRGI